MPTFIKKYPIRNPATGDVTKYVNWNKQELAEKDSSEFFTVPESHAQNVLRPNKVYQEVGDGYITAGTGAVETDAGVTEAVRAGRGTVQNNDGSKRGNSTSGEGDESASRTSNGASEGAVTKAEVHDAVRGRVGNKSKE